MKLRKSLAQQKWRCDYDDLTEEWFVSFDGTEITIRGKHSTRETAAAIAALPKFYALALEVLRVPMVDNALRLVELMAQARAALDAANIQDEPELP